MIHRILLNSLLNRTLRYSAEDIKSITIEDGDNFETKISQIKSEGFTKLVIGTSFQSMPIVEGMYCTKYIEILSTRIQSIPSETFSNNQNIESIILSASIKTISYKAFFGSSVSQINLENVNKIDTEAFCNCINLQSVNLANIRSLSSSCFANTSIIEINLPSECTTIPSYAFCNCFNLASFVSNCNSFGEYAFCNCTSLKVFKYNFRESNQFPETVFMSAAIEEIAINFQLFNNKALSKLSIKKLTIYSPILDEYFYYNLEYYTITDGQNFPNLTTIEFTHDSELICFSNMNIEQIIIPNDPNFRCSIKIADLPKLKNLPNGINTVFYVGDMPEIETVDLTFCTIIYRNSFFNCPKLKRIIGWGDHAMFLGPGLFQFSPLVDINIWNENLSYEVRDIINEQFSPLQFSQIKEININASYPPIFRGCKTLKKVKYIEGSGITRIEYDAFYDCESLTEVELCSSITTIAANAFKNTNISYLDLTNIQELDISAFYGTPLKEIIINKNVQKVLYFFETTDDPIVLEYIERNVYLPKLEKVTFKSEVTIFNTLYFNSPNLKEYVLVDNSNFKSIDKVIYTADKQTLYAYPGGLEAKEFIIPDFVRNVNHNAFAFTNNLEKIIINSNMVLTESTFAYCTSVKTVVINFKTNVLSK